MDQINEKKVLVAIADVRMYDNIVRNLFSLIGQRLVMYWTLDVIKNWA